MKMMNWVVDCNFEELINNVWETFNVPSHVTVEHHGFDCKSDSLILGVPHNIPPAAPLRCHALWHASLQRGREERRDKAGEGWVLCILPPYALAYFDLIPVRAGFLQSVRCGTMLGL